MKKAVNVGVDEFKDCSELSKEALTSETTRQTQLLHREKERERERNKNRQKSSFSNNTLLITTSSNINLVINEENPETIPEERESEWKKGI